MKNTISILLVLAVSTVLIVAWNDYQEQDETMPLIPMMRLLLSDIYQIDEGIYVEDYEQIEKGAASIADHPGMTEEDRELVRTTLGDEIKKFVAFDMQVHHHADSMKMSAKQKNMQEILRHYTIIQQGCVDCHSDYRDRIKEARQEQ